jgi:hypothetical protein
MSEASLKAFSRFFDLATTTTTKVLQNNDTSGFIPYWLKLVMAAIVVVVLIYLFQLTKNIYKEIEKDANVETMSHRISHEQPKPNSRSGSGYSNQAKEVQQHDDEDTAP